MISVGACSAISRYGLLNGNSYGATYQPGEIWPSSSYGMNTFTGERLPHVVAPGYSVVSAVSRYYSRTTGRPKRAHQWLRPSLPAPSPYG